MIHISCRSHQNHKLVTHLGFPCGKHPENTLPSMQKLVFLVLEIE